MDSFRQMFDSKSPARSQQHDSFTLCHGTTEGAAQLLEIKEGRCTAAASDCTGQTESRWAGGD